MGTQYSGHDRTGRSTVPSKREKGKKQQAPKRWEACDVRLINGFTQGAAWLDLSAYARCVYIAIKQYHNGYNNGQIEASVRHLTKRTGFSQGAVEKALVDLKDHGFIVAEAVGSIGFEGKGKGTRWRLTELPTERQNKQATHDYKQWRKAEKFRSPSHERGQGVPREGTGKGTTVPREGTGCPTGRDRKPPANGRACPARRDEIQDYQGWAVGGVAVLPAIFTRPSNPTKAETRNQFTCPDCGAQPGEPCTFPDDGQGRARAKRGINHQRRYLLAVEAGKQQLLRTPQDWAELGKDFLGKVARGEVIEVRERLIPRGPIQWAIQ